MISTEAKNKLEKLKKNYQENFEYVMKTPIDKQQKDWEESALHYQQSDFMKKKEFCLAGLTGEVFSWKDSLEENADKIIVHFHGGGLTLGSAITHRKLGTLISIYTKNPVMVHNYPLAPEHPFPAALEASVHFYEELLKNKNSSQTVIFGGDSSGAGLAVSVILRLKELNIPLPKGLFLLSPQLDNSLEGKSIEENARKDFAVYKEDLVLTGRRYYGDADKKNPFISPIYGDLEQFPPTFIQAGSHEILLSDAVDFAKKLKEAEVEVDLRVWDDMWHVFQSDAEGIPEAQAAMKELAAFIERV